MNKILLTVFSLFILSMGCQAATEVKSGGEGEFCTGADIDCREGFVCVANTCRGQGGSSEYSCSSICERLDFCATGEQDCVSSCIATFNGQCTGTACPWSSDARQAFGKCIVDDLSCDEARENGPDLCFGRLLILEDRKERCDAFVAAANRCGANRTDGLESGCELLGKTATQDSWNRTDACVDRIAADDCGGTETCFNDVFNLSPGINFNAPTNNTTFE